MDISKLDTLLSQTKDKLDAIRNIGTNEAKKIYAEFFPSLKEFLENGKVLLEDSKILQIGVVGQVKSGKSTFLNSLFFDGEDILPKASTPMTAGLTVIEYAKENAFEVEYFTQKDWSVFTEQDEIYRLQEIEIRKQEPNAPETIIKRMIEEVTSPEERSAHEMIEECGAQAKAKIGQVNEIKKFGDKSELQDILEQYVGAEGQFTSVVKSLYIRLNDSRLEGYRIVDTPGVNDPVISRENRTRSFLHACHAVFLLSAASDFLGSGDINFLNNRITKQGISTVLLIASKFDSVLQDLGADFVMKGQEIPDLVEMIESQKRGFIKRVKQMHGNGEIQGNPEIRLDYNSGISYSIAEKYRSKKSPQLSSIEQTVISQMKRFYPDYFQTTQDILETMEGLANIEGEDGIRSKYLDKWFVAKKDKIIQEKIDAYFGANEKDLKEKIQKRAIVITKNIEQLETVKEKEIQEQRHTQGEIFKKLKERFRLIFQKFSISLQSELISIKNKISFMPISKIPTESRDSNFTYNRKNWFGHGSDLFTYEVISGSQLSIELHDFCDKYSRSFNEQWKKLLNSLRNNLSEKLYKEIAEFECKMVRGKFDDFYYRNLVDEIIDSMRLNLELPIGELKKRISSEIARVSNMQFMPERNEIYGMYKDQVQDYLYDGFQNELNNVRNESQSLQYLFVDLVNKEIKERHRNINDDIETMKSQFVVKLEEEGEEHLKDLEFKLKDKEKSLHEARALKEKVNELVQLF